MKRIIFWTILFGVNIDSLKTAIAKDNYYLFTLALVACLMAAFMLIVRIVEYINNK